MPRRKYSDPRVKWNLPIPSTLAAEVELMLHDPFLGNTRFGARSELVEELLRKWLAEQYQVRAKFAEQQQNLPLEPKE